MTEKIKAIQNPLTVIAIFASLAEVMGTVALATLNPESQKVFIWFVMLFPSSLVTFFFATLIFKPQALYAPSDYTSDDNFLRSITPARLAVQALERASEAVADTKNQLSDHSSDSGNQLELERDKLASDLKELAHELKVTTEISKAKFYGGSIGARPKSLIEEKVLQLIEEEGPLTAEAITDEINIGQTAVGPRAILRGIRGLLESGLVLEVLGKGEKGAKTEYIAVSKIRTNDARSIWNPT